MHVDNFHLRTWRSVRGNTGDLSHDVGGASNEGNAHHHLHHDVRPHAAEAPADRTTTAAEHPTSPTYVYQDDGSSGQSHGLAQQWGRRQRHATEGSLEGSDEHRWGEHRLGGVGTELSQHHQQVQRSPSQRAYHGHQHRSPGSSELKIDRDRNARGSPANRSTSAKHLWDERGDYADGGGEVSLVRSAVGDDSDGVEYESVDKYTRDVQQHQPQHQREQQQHQHLPAGKRPRRQHGGGGGGRGGGHTDHITGGTAMMQQHHHSDDDADIIRPSYEASLSAGDTRSDGGDQRGVFVESRRPDNGRRIWEGYADAPSGGSLATATDSSYGRQTGSPSAVETGQDGPRQRAGNVVPRLLGGRRWESEDHPASDSPTTPSDSRSLLPHQGHGQQQHESGERGGRREGAAPLSPSDESSPPVSLSIDGGSGVRKTNVRMARVVDSAAMRVAIKSAVGTSNSGGEGSPRPMVLPAVEEQGGGGDKDGGEAKEKQPAAVSGGGEPNKRQEAALGAFLRGVS